MTDALSADLARLSVKLATGAVAVITRTGREAMDVSAKSSTTDLVTAVDRAAEAWLVDRIAQARPSDVVVGEEGGGRSGTSGVRWILDPIDGTVNFVLGLPQYAVSVAAEVDGRVVAGAVCNAASGELFQACLGEGAFVDGKRLRGPRDVPLERAVVGTGFAYDRECRGRQATVVAELMTRLGDIRRLGSASLDLCAVAAGRLDAYFEAGLHVWDYAAGLLIALESGCVASGLRGAPVSSRLTAVAGAVLAPAFFDLLEQVGADEVGG